MHFLFGILQFEKFLVFFFIWIQIIYVAFSFKFNSVLERKVFRDSKRCGLFVKVIVQKQSGSFTRRGSETNILW